MLVSRRLLAVARDRRIGIRRIFIGLPPYGCADRPLMCSAFAGDEPLICRSRGITRFASSDHSPPYKGTVPFEVFPGRAGSIGSVVPIMVMLGVAKSRCSSAPRSSSLPAAPGMAAAGGCPRGECDGRHTHNAPGTTLVNHQQPGEDRPMRQKAMSPRRKHGGIGKLRPDPIRARPWTAHWTHDDGAVLR